MVPCPLACTTTVLPTFGSQPATLLQAPCLTASCTSVSTQNLQEDLQLQEEVECLELQAMRFARCIMILPAGLTRRWLRNNNFHKPGRQTSVLGTLHWAVPHLPKLEIRTILGPHNLFPFSNMAVVPQASPSCEDLSVFEDFENELHKEFDRRVCSAHHSHMVMKLGVALKLGALTLIVY